MNKELTGTAKQFNTYLSTRENQQEQHSLSSEELRLQTFSRIMTQMLLTRIKEEPGEITPPAYALKAMFLRHDCESQGTNRLKENIATPPEVTKQSVTDYDQFMRQSVELAAGAFGEPYATRVATLYDYWNNPPSTPIDKTSDNLDIGENAAHNV